MKLIHQASIGGGLFDGVEVVALDVLDEGQFQALVGRGLFHEHHRYLVQPGQGGGAQAAFAGDQGVAVALALGDQQWLDHTLFPDRVSQLLELVLVEITARLVRVCRYLVNIAEEKFLFSLRGILREERPHASAQHVFCAHVRPPPAPV